MSKILIIGNGFDLNLGLKTSYRDFISGIAFEKLIEANNNFAGYLKSKNLDGNWVDIEHELKNFCSGTYSDRFSRDHIKVEFVALKKTLSKYLIDLINFHEDRNKENTQAFKIIEQGYLIPTPSPSANDLEGFSNIFTFNYTKLFNFTQLGFNSHTLECNIHYVHGSLKENNIVFGVEDNALSNKFSYLNKSDHAAFGNVPDVSAAIIQAKEVHFFGCSLGDTDNAHFLRAFKEISTNTSYDIKDADKRRIYFYVFGQNGYREIYNRIMTLTERRLSEFKLINHVTFFDLFENKKIDQEWLNR